MNEKLQKLYDLAVDELTNNILPWWIEHDVDEEHGGFYGAVTNDNAPVPHATRFITLNASGLDLLGGLSRDGQSRIQEDGGSRLQLLHQVFLG